MLCGRVSWEYGTRWEDGRYRGRVYISQGQPANTLTSSTFNALMFTHTAFIYIFIIVNSASEVLPSSIIIDHRSSGFTLANTNTNTPTSSPLVTTPPTHQRDCRYKAQNASTASPLMLFLVFLFYCVTQPQNTPHPMIKARGLKYLNKFLLLSTMGIRKEGMFQWHLPKERNQQMILVLFILSICGKKPQSQWDKNEAEIPVSSPAHL